MSKSAERERTLLLFCAYKSHFTSTANLLLCLKNFEEKSFNEEYVLSFFEKFEEKKEYLRDILLTEQIEKYNFIDSLLAQLMLCERLFFFTKSQNLLHYLNISKIYSTKDSYKVLHVLMNKFLNL